MPRLEDEMNARKDILPHTVISVCRVLFVLISSLSERIEALSLQLKQVSKQDDVAKRLMTMPGVGPVTAVSLSVLAPPPGTFSKGRDFAAWIGLAPRQHSTGGKTKLGRTSKMGQRDLRRLLIIGAMSTIQSAERRGGAPEGSWLARMLARKPKMLVAVALANKMARIAWVLMTRGGAYETPARFGPVPRTHHEGPQRTLLHKEAGYTEELDRSTMPNRKKSLASLGASIHGGSAASRGSRICACQSVS